MILQPKIKTVTVRREGTQVILISDGNSATSMPWDVALEVSKAITIQARQAESEAKVLGIIQDQALITRLGLPFGITRHIKVMKEAIKEACWNTNLRRYIPASRAKGIASGEVVGTPALIQHQPIKEA